MKVGESSLKPGSPLMHCFILCVEGENLVHFDHVLDVVGCDYQLAVNFAHALRRLMLAMSMIIG